jgi:putative resolvase
MKQGEPGLLCVSKAAHELGRHPFTMRYWIKLGKIDAVWFGQAVCSLRPPQ